jgi:hypothetical protein
MTDEERWTGLSPSWPAAEERLRTNPAALTDEQCALLEPTFGGVVRQKRADAIMAKYANQPSSTKAVSPAGRASAGWTSADLQRDGETFERWLKRVATRATPMAFFGELFAIVKEQRNEIIKLKTANAALEARVTGVEAKKHVTGVRFVGPYESGKTYYSGEEVQRGGYWQCVVPETATQPGTSMDWRLVHRR